MNTGVAEAQFNALRSIQEHRKFAQELDGLDLYELSQHELGELYDRMLTQEHEIHDNVRKVETLKEVKRMGDAADDHGTESAADLERENEGADEQDATDDLPDEDGA